MITGNQAAERARWEVLWVKDRKLHRVGTGSDFHEAVRLYTLAVQSGDRTGVTLRCMNMGFPLPTKYQERIVTFEKPRRLRNGKVVDQVRLQPMAKLNRQGVFWCPFCAKLRRFVFEKGYITREGAYMPEPRLRCPMCNVGHTSMDVRKWNPLASQMFYSQNVRDPTKPVRRRRPRPKRPPQEES